MRALPLIALLPLVLAAPALAQEHQHQHGMPAMDHAAIDHPGHAMAGTATPGNVAEPAPAAADDAPGNAPPPPVPTDYPADRFFPKARMEAARAGLAAEGKWTGSAVMLDRLEYRAGLGATSGGEGYAWKGSAWYGSDLNKLVIASEGEGVFGEGAERVEVQALWRRAVSPYFNLEAGVRQDFRPEPRRTYGVIGIEGHAPYWIETEAQLFVSHKGDVHARVAASHDLRLSGPLVLQPEVEVNFAFQEVPELHIGAGFERIEAGARLRYEIRPELAPYVGVSWESSLGGTARTARAHGEQVSAVAAVVGLKAFF